MMAGIILQDFLISSSLTDIIRELKLRFRKKVEQVNILDCIPIGHKNAIDRDVLNDLMHMGERQVRRLIKEVNDSEDDSLLIINLQDGKGYFRPAPDENNLVKIW